MGYKNTQHYRHTVHLYLDAIWTLGSNKRKARSTMYGWLANRLNLPKELTHVKYFTRDQCKQAIKILRPMYIQLYGHDLSYKGKEKPKMKLQTTSSYNFETAHILPSSQSCNYEGLYSRAYRLTVTVEGPTSEPYGWIIPQEDLREAIEYVVPNRQFIFYRDNPVCVEVAKILDKYNIPHIELPYEVVDENLIQYIKEKLDIYIRDVLHYTNIKVVEMELSSLTSGYSTKLKEGN